MRRMELVGRGIGHSASPGMWNRIFDEVSAEVTYGLRDVDEAELPAAVDDLRTGVVDTFHVTMPYKEWAFGVSGTYGEDVRATGVANGLTMRDSVIEGVNTDVAAARLLLAEAPRRVRRALVLGAGATGASLLLAVTEIAEDVYLTNRTPERSSRLAGRAWPHQVTAVPWHEREKCAREVDLVVNTTPCGLTTPDSPLRTWTAGPDALLYDLIYQRELTPLQVQAAAAGVRTVDGLSHLQAHAEATLSRLGIAPPPVGTLRQIMTDVGARPPLRWDRPHTVEALH
jgi:shikimate dehydrogenase